MTVNNFSVAKYTNYSIHQVQQVLLGALRKVLLHNILLILIPFQLFSPTTAAPYGIGSNNSPSLISNMSNPSKIPSQRMHVFNSSTTMWSLYKESQRQRNPSYSTPACTTLRLIHWLAAEDNEYKANTEMVLFSKQCNFFLHTTKECKIHSLAISKLKGVWNS